MITRVLVKLLGGFWGLKERCRAAKPGLARKLLIRLYREYQRPFGSSIAWNSEFSGPPCMPHGPSGIFVTAVAQVGKNSVIFQQVTIGANTLPDSSGMGAPTIGDNCYIGAGAKIIGNVRIGNNVRIAANSVVYQDVPDDSLVVSGIQRTLTRPASGCNRFHAYIEGSWRYFDDGSWIVENDPDVCKALAFCIKSYER